MEPYSIEKHKQVLELDGEGLKTKQIAEELGVSPAWVRRVKQRYRQDRSIGPRPAQRGRKLKLDPHARQKLGELVRQQPDATLSQLRQRLGMAVGLATLWRALRDLKLVLKKSLCAPVNRTVPT